MQAESNKPIRFLSNCESCQSKELCPKFVRNRTVKITNPVEVQVEYWDEISRFISGVCEFTTQRASHDISNLSQEKVEKLRREYHVQTIEVDADVAGQAPDVPLILTDSLRFLDQVEVVHDLIDDAAAEH